jgi:hypothetical protein
MFAKGSLVRCVRNEGFRFLDLELYSVYKVLESYKQCILVQGRRGDVLCSASRFVAEPIAHKAAKVRVGGSVRLSHWTKFLKVIGEDGDNWIVGDETGGNSFAKCMAWIAQEQPKLDLTKPVQTRDGQPVRILCTNGPLGAYPVVGVVGNTITSWTINGQHWAHDWSDHSLNLINVPLAPLKPVVVSRWIGLHAGKNFLLAAASVKTEEQAQAWAKKTPGVIALKQVNLTEGYGIG